MDDFVSRIAGKICDITTTEDTYYECLIKDVVDNWLVICEDENEPEIVKYINLKYVVAIEPAVETLNEKKPRKRLFGKSKKEEDEC